MPARTPSDACGLAEAGGWTNPRAQARASGSARSAAQGSVAACAGRLSACRRARPSRSRRRAQGNAPRVCCNPAAPVSTPTGKSAPRRPQPNLASSHASGGHPAAGLCPRDRTRGGSRRHRARLFSGCEMDQEDGREARDQRAVHHPQAPADERGAASQAVGGATRIRGVVSPTKDCASAAKPKQMKSAANPCRVISMLEKTHQQNIQKKPKQKSAATNLVNKPNKKKTHAAEHNRNGKKYEPRSVCKDARNGLRWAPGIVTKLSKFLYI